MEIVKQKVSDNYWQDETGDAVQTKRLTKLEKKREANAYKIYQKALAANKQLQELKQLIVENSEEVFKLAMLKAQADTDSRKGNLTWYNFNHSIKVVTKMSEPIQFDDAMITAAKQHFHDFIAESNKSDLDGFEDFILDAFESRNGQLDTAKVMKLLKWESRFNKESYSKACKAIQDAIRKPTKKAYHQVWVRNSEGKYESIDLNLATV